MAQLFSNVISSMKFFSKKRGNRSLSKLLFALFSLAFFALFSSFLQPKSIETPSEQSQTSFYSTDTEDDLQAVYIAAIQEARSSITLLIYSLLDKKIISALRAKAEAGIKVVVVADPVASQGVERKLGDKVTTIFSRSSSGLMHCKALAIDGKQVWFGSTNITYEACKIQGNLLFGLYSQTVADIIEQKGIALFKKKKLSSAFYEIALPGQMLSFYWSPEAGKRAEEKIEQLITTAKKSVKVAMFTFTNKRFVQALSTAQARGVDIAVIFDRESSATTSKTVYQQCKRLKIPCGIRNKDGLMHHKLCIIDDTTLIFGSSNWTRAAFSTNDEATLILSPLLEEQKTTLQKIWDGIYRSSSLNK